MPKASTGFERRASRRRPTKKLNTKRRDDQRARYLRVPPAIEEQRGEHQPAQRGARARPAGEHEKADQRDRQEDEDELERVEQHEADRPQLDDVVDALARARPLPTPVALTSAEGPRSPVLRQRDKDRAARTGHGRCASRPATRTRPLTEPPGVGQMARQPPGPHGDQIEAQDAVGVPRMAQQEQLGGAPRARPLARPERVQRLAPARAAP